MSIKEIEAAIAQLPPDELAQLAAWFVEFHAEAWDEQIEADAKSGKLDRLAREAERDFSDGKCTPL